MATPGHVNPPPHAPETTNLPTTTAESPPKHLPSELPASAENLAASGTANQAVPDGNNMEGVPSKPSVRCRQRNHASSFGSSTPL